MRGISEIFANRNHDTNLLLRGEAVESNIKSQGLKKYSLVHFATHGVVDEKNPQLSRIFLHANNTRSEDGTLYSGEIYNR